MINGGRSEIQSPPRPSPHYRHDDDADAND